MSTSTAATLRAARAKIERPEQWVKGAYALDAEGRAVDPEDPRVCRRCVVGAVMAVAAMSFPALHALRAIVHNVPGFNDAPSTTHADVLAAFDLAIADEEAAQ